MQIIRALSCGDGDANQAVVLCKRCEGRADMLAIVRYILRLFEWFENGDQAILVQN